MKFKFVAIDVIKMENYPILLMTINVQTVFFILSFSLFNFMQHSYKIIHNIIMKSKMYTRDIVPCNNPKTTETQNG